MYRTRREAIYRAIIPALIILLILALFATRAHGVSSSVTVNPEPPQAWSAYTITINEAGKYTVPRWTPYPTADGPCGRSFPGRYTPIQFVCTGPAVIHGYVAAYAGVPFNVTRDGVVVYQATVAGEAKVVPPPVPPTTPPPPPPPPPVVEPIVYTRSGSVVTAYNPADVTQNAQIITTYGTTGTSDVLTCSRYFYHGPRGGTIAYPQDACRGPLVPGQTATVWESPR